MQSSAPFSRQHRHEGIEDARRLDELTRQAWEQHHDLEILDNSTDFPTKMARLEASVLQKLEMQDSANVASTSSNVAATPAVKRESTSPSPPSKKTGRPATAVSNCIKVVARQLLATRDGDPYTVRRLRDNYWQLLLGGKGESYCRKLLSPGITVQPSAVQCSEVQHSALQHSALQCNAVQCPTLLCRICRLSLQPDRQLAATPQRQEQEDCVFSLL